MEFLAPILDLAGKLTVVGILFVDLIVVVVGLQRQWWVPGWLYRNEVADKLKWYGIAARYMGVAERAVGVAETIAPAAISREGA